MFIHEKLVNELETVIEYDFFVSLRSPDNLHTLGEMKGTPSYAFLETTMLA